jgi:deoxyribodipyrimidine photo-lyase
MLQLAHQRHDYVVHFFCFDERIFHGSVDFSRTLPTTSWPKMGKFKTKFIVESVHDLQKSIGSITQQGMSFPQNLVLRSGLPEEIIPQIAQLSGASVVYCHEGEASEEMSVQVKLKSHLKQVGCTLHPVWGNTMYHIDDMPPHFLERFPESATQFRTLVESRSAIRTPISAPGTPKGYAFKSLPPSLVGTERNFDFGNFEALAQSVLPPQSKDETDENLVFSIPSGEIFTPTGGETNGLARLQEYFFDKDCLKSYFSTRNGMLGIDYSSKFSPWLAAGCLSPRLIAAEVRRYEAERVKSKETYWMLFELTFRDYFRYYTRFHDSKVFKLWGPKGKKKSTRQQQEAWSTDLARFETWRLGRTGNPMIDANMRELLQTGFMSNRGRQIVASYLTRDMNMDWRLGAMHFESLLIDHDVSLNWGNWTYAAGVGSDPREDRYFNIPKQTYNYDPQYKFIKFWCEEARLIGKEQLSRALKSGLKPHVSLTGKKRGQSNKSTGFERTKGIQAYMKIKGK